MCPIHKVEGESAGGPQLLELLQKSSWKAFFQKRVKTKERASSQTKQIIFLKCVLENLALHFLMGTKSKEMNKKEQSTGTMLVSVGPCC